MSGRGFQGLKEQAEGAAKDAGKEDEHHCLFAGAVDKACKTAQDGVEKAAGQAAEAVSGFGKKCGFKK
uniref:Adipogenesis regulatory factor n=1 Tax=Coturnix japonica TaxID=93934 RepID=A0A8C2YBU3_COTJA